MENDAYLSSNTSLAAFAESIGGRNERDQESNFVRVDAAGEGRMLLMYGQNQLDSWVTYLSIHGVGRSGGETLRHYCKIYHTLVTFKVLMGFQVTS